MDAPKDIVTRLKGIRSTFELRWNPRARLVKTNGFDAFGNVKDPVWEPRWEVWDMADNDHPSYKLMTVQNPEDKSFRFPDDGLITFLQKIDPARYGGDPEKLVAAMVDSHEEIREQVDEDEWDDFCEMVARYGKWLATPKTKLPQSKPRGTPISQLVLN